MARAARPCRSASSKSLRSRARAPRAWRLAADLGALGVEDGAAKRERPLVERLRLVEVAQLDVDLAQHGHHLGLERGLAGQLVLDPGGPLREQLVRGDRPICPLGRVGELEQAEEEFLHGLGPLGLALDGAGLDQRARESGHEEDHEGRGRRHAHAVAADEFPHAVADRLLPCRHRMAVLIAAEVLDHHLGRGVAPVRLLPQRLQQDRVEVAAEAAAEPADGLGPRGAHVLRVHGLDRAVRLADVLREDDDGARADRLLLADDALDLGGRAPLEVVRAVAREQLVERHAEGVDVRRRRDGVAADLLGRGVLRRHHLQPGLRLDERVLGVRLVEELRDAEVEQLGHAVGRDEDVRRLDVAVDDEVAVGVGDGLGDGAKQPQPLAEAEAALVAILRDGLAVDELHREVGLAFGRDATVEESGDVRVLEAGEDLALLQEAAEDLVAAHARPDQLERDPLLELPVGALGEVDRAHPALPERADDAVRPHRLPGFEGGLRRGPLDVLDEGGGPVRRRVVEEVAGLVVGGEELFEVGAEGEVGGAVGGAAGRVEERRAGVRREVERVVEQRGEALPAFGIDRVHSTGGDGRERRGRARRLRRRHLRSAPGRGRRAPCASPA